MPCSTCISHQPKNHVLPNAQTFHLETDLSDDCYWRLTSFSWNACLQDLRGTIFLSSIIHWHKKWCLWLKRGLLLPVCDWESIAVKPKLAFHEENIFHWFQHRQHHFKSFWSELCHAASLYDTKTYQVKFHQDRKSMLTTATEGITPIQLTRLTRCIFHGTYPWYFLQDSNSYFTPLPQLCLISRDTQALLLAFLTTQTQTLFIYSGYCFQAVVQDRQCSHPHHPHFPAQCEHCRYAVFVTRLVINCSRQEAIPLSALLLLLLE